MKVNRQLLSEAEQLGVLSRDLDDILDDAIMDAAPEIVQLIREQEVDEDIDEFIDGAIHGSWDANTQDYADPPQIGDEDSIGIDETTEMYVLGYEWGWNNPKKIQDGKNIPDGIRREMIEYALENFESRITEEFVINAVEKAIGFVKKQMGDVHDILKKAKEKFGWKVAPIVVSIEVVEHAILPTILGAMNPIFYGLTAVPTVEILAATALAIAKARMPATVEPELPPGHLDWYETEYAQSANESLIREYVRELITEDPMGFVHDLAAASEEFGGEGEMFIGGDPGKGGGKAIKRAFNANADHQWLSTLDTVHWVESAYSLEGLVGRSRDELSTTMTLPSDKLKNLPGMLIGLWVKGRITIAANDHDQLFTGRRGDYVGQRAGYTAEEQEQRQRSSGVNKIPRVSKDYSRYDQLKKGNEYGERLARNIPYVLDQSMWDPAGVNEALVDNWNPVGIVVGKWLQPIKLSIQSLDDERFKDQAGVNAPGVIGKIFKLAVEFDVPIYDVNRTKLWSPE